MRLLAAFLATTCLSLIHAHESSATDVDCDIVVAGGSTASLAAAISASEAAPELTVCMTEITDWPGGQMTAGGVPAIDFGGLDDRPENQPTSFRETMAYLGGPDHNPGACSVSIMCYLPNHLVNGYIMPKLQSLPNLKLFLRTTIIDTVKAADGNISYLVAVQRTPRDPSTEWSRRLSDDLPDWYSPIDSNNFTKQTFQLHGRVFIEATELADVLVTGNFTWTQGPEIPYENSTTAQSTCGQAWTLTYYMQLMGDDTPPPSIPKGNDAGQPFQPWGPPGTSKGWTRSTWNYRRSRCAGNTSLDAVNVGDISQQNRINDLDTAYVPLPADLVRSQRPWQGGLNLTALRMLEDRAYGSFWFTRSTSPHADWTQRLTLNFTTSNTGHGLSKFPYLRDTRRGFGLTDQELHEAGFHPPQGDAPSSPLLRWQPSPEPARPAAGYRFMFWDISQQNTSDPPVQPSVSQPDTIAITRYNDDHHPLTVCNEPAYMQYHTTYPFYLPARMIVQRGVGNLLLAGKTTAMTFHANGAVRLHPGEWVLGVAAAAGSVLFVREKMETTAQLLENHAAALKAFVNSSAFGQPLQWSDSGGSDDPQIGWVCADFGSANSRCVGTDKKSKGDRHLYPADTCSAACQPLAKDEWLANAEYWTAPDASGTIRSMQATALKKSVALSRDLPADEVKDVDANTPCKLVAQQQFVGYWLCTAA